METCLLIFIMHYFFNIIERLKYLHIFYFYIILLVIVLIMVSDPSDLSLSFESTYNPYLFIQSFHFLPKNQNLEIKISKLNF
jgi:hypothetical protein